MYEKVMKKCIPMQNSVTHMDNEGSVNLPAASKMLAAGRVK